VRRPLSNSTKIHLNSHWNTIPWKTYQRRSLVKKRGVGGLQTANHPRDQSTEAGPWVNRAHQWYPNRRSLLPKSNANPTALRVVIQKSANIRQIRHSHWLDSLMGQTKTRSHVPYLGWDCQDLLFRPSGSEIRVFWCGFDPVNIINIT
jgi:hypothetical protein